MNKRQKKKNESRESTSRRFTKALQYYHNMCIAAYGVTQEHMDMEMRELVDKYKSQMPAHLQ